MCIAVGRAHLDDVVAHFEHRDVEGASTKVENNDFLIFLFIKPVCKCGCGRFVDNAFDIETSNFARIAGRGALRIVEVCRYRDDSFGNGFAQFSLSVVF